MQNPLQQRLLELREEFNNGQSMLAELETRQSQLRESLLRISGAIQVLEELSAATEKKQQTPQQPDLKPETNISAMEEAVKQAV